VTNCAKGGKLAAKKGRGIYVDGNWIWRCHCGGVATANKMGWVDGKFGLIINQHQVINQHKKGEK
jgi:hypothetical protein